MQRVSLLMIISGAEVGSFLPPDQPALFPSYALRTNLLFSPRVDYVPSGVFVGVCEGLCVYLCVPVAAWVACRWVRVSVCVCGDFEEVL